MKMCINEKIRYLKNDFTKKIHYIIFILSISNLNKNIKQTSR